MPNKTVEKTKKSTSKSGSTNLEKALADLGAATGPLGSGGLAKVRLALEELSKVDDWGRGAVLASAARGDLAALTQAINYGLPVDGMGFDGKDALSLAASAGSLECIRKLAKAGCSPLADEEGATALERAFAAEAMAVFGELAKRWPDLALACFANFVAIAAFKKSEALFDKALEFAASETRCDLQFKRKGAISKSEWFGLAPVAIAALAGKADWVERLIDAGIDVDEPCVEMATALERCASAGLKDMCLLLLDFGASIEPAWSVLDKSEDEGEEGGSASKTVRVSECPEAVPFMGGFMKSGRALASAPYLAYAHGHMDLAAEFVSRGVNPWDVLLGRASRGRCGYPPADLAWAVALSKPADANDFSYGDGSALVRSVYTGDHDLIQALMDAGADPRMSGEDSGSAIEECEKSLAMYKAAGNFLMPHPWVAICKKSLAMLRAKAKDLDRKGL